MDPSPAARLGVGAPTPDRPPDPGELARLRRVAEDFEAILLSQLLRQMREATPRDGLLRGGGGLRTYQGLLDDELGRALARAGGIGLAPVLTRDLSRLLKPGPGPSSPRPPVPIAPAGEPRREGGGLP
jgi:flagellar protein FlgJ